MDDEIKNNMDKGDSSIDFSDLNKIARKISPEAKKNEVNIAETSAQLFDKTLENLSTISGFLTAGIYNNKGDVLAHIILNGFNFDKIGSLAIELCAAAESISDKLNLGMCNFVETHTESYIFIHMCVASGKGAMGVILDKNGNIGLTRQKMRKEGSTLIQEFK